MFADHFVTVRHKQLQLDVEISSFFFIFSLCCSNTQLFRIKKYTRTKIFSSSFISICSYSSIKLYVNASMNGRICIKLIFNKILLYRYFFYVQKFLAVDVQKNRNKNCQFVWKQFVVKKSISRRD